MFRLVWLFLVGCLALCVELAVAPYGLLFPGALFAAFYLGLAFRLRTGVVSGLLVAVVVEILLVRRATLVPVFVPLLGFLWVFGRWGDRLSPLNQAVAGLGLAWTHAGYYVVAENLYFGAGWCLLSGPHALALFLKAGLTGALATPLLIAGLDWVADRTGVTPFAYGTGGSV